MCSTEDGRRLFPLAQNSHSKILLLRAWPDGAESRRQMVLPLRSNSASFPTLQHMCNHYSLSPPVPKSSLAV
eukprot:7391914-Prymnesium_polylepis.1